MRRLLATVVVAACGGDDGVSVIADAAMQQDAPEQTNCLVQPDYGALGSKTGTAGMMGGVTATFTLDAGPPRDTFFLKMVTGKGVFTGGIAIGTYTIAGDDADYNDCGLCVHIIADIVSGVGPTKFYFANAGSVTLTSTSPPISGSAQNLTFREVDIGTGAPTGTCTSAIGSIMFTTP